MLGKKNVRQKKCQVGRKSRGRKGQGRGIKVGVKNIDAYSSTF